MDYLTDNHWGILMVAAMRDNNERSTREKVYEHLIRNVTDGEVEQLRNNFFSNAPDYISSFSNENQHYILSGVCSKLGE